jgi:hypothetical protein
LTVVVVGNSRDLLTRDDGHKIDACDRVVRINAFCLDEYGKHVGSRIDIVSLCFAPQVIKWTMARSAHLVTRAQELWTPSWRGQAPARRVERAMEAFDRPVKDLVYSDDTGHKQVVTDLYWILEEAATRSASTKTPPVDGRQCFPTTGLQTLHLARARFPGADLYLTGFGLSAPLDPRRLGVGRVWHGHDLVAERTLLTEGITAGTWRAL